MSWNSLGTLVANQDWQLFDLPSTSLTFRASFYGDLDRVWYFARLRQYFSNDDVSLSLRVYPSRKRLVFEFPIPSELQNQGQAIRYLGARKFPARRHTMPDTNWIIELEELV